ncbi:hypothetical protein [Luteimonas saliphila]|uniref:hypothetical protein n=1 Tax=Luteimonas saliphila TaxID=2804919 RepID=UPI00192D6680|nr:hypothetical protein [Luteimonas saliphila]
MSRRDHEPLTPEERDLAGRLSRLDPQAAPSAALDAAILAAARAQHSGGGSTSPGVRGRSRRPRWPVGLGIAASLAVAVGIAWQLRPLPETRALSAPSELELPRAVVAEPVPARATAAPPIATGDAEEAPAAEAGAATVAADEARAMSGPRPAPTASAARDRREAAAADDRTATDAAARQAATRKAEHPREQASAQRAAAPPAEARARHSDSIEIVFDQVAPPPPPPTPPAPPAPASGELRFVPSPPAAATDSPRPDAEGGDAAFERRPSAAPAAVPPAARTEAEGAALDEIIVTGSRIEPAPATVDAHADQPLDDQPPASVDSPEVRATWLQRIRELRDAGQAEEASASLREFVRRHPQAEVPADLRPLLRE